MERKTITLDMLRASFAPKGSRLEELPPFQLAAVLLEFELEELRQRSLQLFSHALSKENEQLLLRHSVTIERDIAGQWYSLKDYDRINILREIEKSGSLSRLVERVRGYFESPEQQGYFDCLEGKIPDLRSQSLDQLAMTHKISRWLEDIFPQFPSEETVLSFMKREELLAPFRLITSNFQGRKKLLAKIKKYIDDPDPKHPLLVTGIGGIGKSTLIAKLILDHHQHDQQGRIPFVYIDFDRPGVSVSEPLQLALEGLRQLALQFPEPSATFKDVSFQDVHREVKDYLRGRQEKASKQSKSTTTTRGILIESIERRYLNRYREQLNTLEIPVLIILDSFEEAQYRASASDLNNLFNFFGEILQYIPGARLIIVGRDDLVESGFKFQQEEVEEFDEEAGSGFLRARGVADETLQAAIFNQFGGNPLTLKLAANYVVQQMADHPGKAYNFGKLFEGINKERLQEQLVRRNLSHIKNEKAKEIAFPGMLVRQISPAIIQQVLAVPCGLGELSDPEAEAIFYALGKESFLLKREGDSLTFRRDLRVALYELIIEKYREEARQIYDLAVVYYQDRPSPKDRAEYLYYRLMRGDDPAICEEIYTPEIKPYIENSLSELPLNAYVHFATKMGIKVGRDYLEKVRLTEWEKYLIGEIRDILENGDESALRRKKQMLEVRSDRTYHTDLYRYEAKVYLRLAEFQVAKDLLDEAKATKKDHLAYVLLQSQLAEYQLDFELAGQLLADFEVDQAPDRSLGLCVEYLISRIRIHGRLGTAISDLEKEVQIIYELLAPSIKASGLQVGLDQIQASFPITYRLEGTHLFPSPKSIGDAEKLHTGFEVLSRSIMSAEAFRDLLNSGINSIDDKLDLEKKLFSQFRVAIDEISEPAVFRIALMDIINFLEQQLKGDGQRIAGAFFGIPAPEPEETGTMPGQQQQQDSGQKKGEDPYEIAGAKTRIKKLIADGRTQQALDEAMKLAQSEDSRNDLILLTGRYNALKREEIMGTISRENATLNKNRLISSLLYYLDDL